jgi:hypothetical protein
MTARWQKNVVSLNFYQNFLYRKFFENNKNFRKLIIFVHDLVSLVEHTKSVKNNQLEAKI